MFPSLNNANQTFIDLFCKFFDLCKEYNSCLISFLSFSESFPAFDWAKEIGNLSSIWSAVSIFSPCPDCCLLNSRIFSTISTISFGFSVSFSFSLIYSIFSFKSINPFLIKLPEFYSFLHYFSILKFFPQCSQILN